MNPTSLALPLAVADTCDGDSASILDSRGFALAAVHSTPILDGYAEKLGIRHWADKPGAAYYDATHEDVMALAELFAAAPDLLTRLEWAVEKLDECGKRVAFTLGMVRSLNDCREVIARAKGAR